MSVQMPLVLLHGLTAMTTTKKEKKKEASVEVQSLALVKTFIVAFSWTPFRGAFQTK